METHEVINSIKFTIEDIIKNNLHLPGYQYLVKSFYLPNNCIIRVTTDRFNWTDLKDMINNPSEWLNYSQVFKLSFKGDISIIIDNQIVDSKSNVDFDLEIDTWFKIRNESCEYSFRILDNVLKKTKDYISAIEDICTSQKIPCLFDEDMLIAGKNPISFATEITRKPRSEKFEIHDFNFFDDIGRTSQEIKYLLGEVLLLRSYLTNFIANPAPFSGKIIYTYFPTFVDSRFFRFTGLLIESLYKFWDKIGDLLAIYFTPNLQQHQIYFTTVLDSIPSIFKASNHYDWLISFKSNEYKLLNDKRKEVVHYKNIESKFHERYSENFTNRKALEELNDEKMSLTIFLVDQVNKTVIGFEKAFSLIDEIK